MVLLGFAMVLLGFCHGFARFFVMVLLGFCHGFAGGCHGSARVLLLFCKGFAIILLGVCHCFARVLPWFCFVEYPANPRRVVYNPPTLGVWNITHQPSACGIRQISTIATHICQTSTIIR